VLCGAGVALSAPAWAIPAAAAAVTTGVVIAATYVWDAVGRPVFSVDEMGNPVAVTGYASETAELSEASSVGFETSYDVPTTEQALQASASDKPATGKRPSGYRKGVTEEVRAKNGGKCVYCGADADTNDHKIPWKELKEGVGTRAEELDRYNDVDNLDPACRSCNSRRGAQPQEEYRRRYGGSMPD
jgi:hypothetical protein